MQWHAITAASIPTVQWSPLVLAAAVTQNPVTRCHETFALQEFLNKRCHEVFVQIVRREYHYHRLSPSPISNNTTDTGPPHHYNVTLVSGSCWPIRTQWAALHQSDRSLRPGLTLGGNLSVTGWSCSLTSGHWMLSHSDIPAHKNCIEIHLLTRLLEVLSERVSFSQNKRSLYSVWMQRSKSMSVVVKGRVSYIDLKSGEFHVKLLQVSRAICAGEGESVMHNLPAATWRYNQFKIEIFFSNLHPKPAIFVIIQVTMWRIALTQQTRRLTDFQALIKIQANQKMNE